MKKQHLSIWDFSKAKRYKIENKLYKKGVTMMKKKCTNASGTIFN